MPLLPQKPPGSSVHRDTGGQHPPAQIFPGLSARFSYWDIIRLHHIIAYGRALCHHRNPEILLMRGVPHNSSIIDPASSIRQVLKFLHSLGKRLWQAGLKSGHQEAG